MTACRPSLAATCAVLALSAGTAAKADVPAVVTDIPPVHALVAQVMGDLGTPVLMLGRGADAHNFQLRPSQAASLAEADLVFWIGPEMTPWLDRALDGIGGGAEAVALLGAGGSMTRAFGETHDHAAHGDDAHGETGHDHAEHGDHAEAGHLEAGHMETGHAEAGHADHDHAHEHGEEGHSHEGTDPHAWLDPANARAWLAVIRDQLAEADPENAATYAANAEAAGAALDALDADLKARLAPVAGKPFVVFHDAYGYFADAYGLTVAGTIALGDAADPGAARIAEVRETLRADGAVCLFAEANHSPDLVAMLAEGTGVRTGLLDPEGSLLDPGPGLYAALLTGLAGEIATCLSGPGG